jgi:hypothetical protein
MRLLGICARSQTSGGLNVSTHLEQHRVKLLAYWSYLVLVLPYSLGYAHWFQHRHYKTSQAA